MGKKKNKSRDAIRKSDAQLKKDHLKSLALLVKLARLMPAKDREEFLAYCAKYCGGSAAFEKAFLDPSKANIAALATVAE